MMPYLVFRPSIPPERQGAPATRRLTPGRRYFLLFLVIGLSTTATVRSGIIEQARQVLEERRAKLMDYSAEVSIRTSPDSPRGRQEIRIEAVQYFGSAGQFRQEITTGLSGGGELPPFLAGGTGNRPGGRPGIRGAGGRGSGLWQLLSGPDLLSRLAELDQATLTETAASSPGKFVEIRFKPSLNNLQLSDGRLRVDARTGQPVKLLLRFNMGFFITDGHLELEYGWNEEGRVAVPVRQLIRYSMSGGGEFAETGRTTEIVSSWHRYLWNLELAADFFTRPAATAAAEGAANRPAAPRSAASADEDPFAELRPAAPRQETRTAEEGTAPVRDQLIQGAAARDAGTGGFPESDQLRRIMEGGSGPSGGPGREGAEGPGGPGGAGGPGGMGGMRGAFIAGARANRLQGSAQGGFGSSALDARPYTLRNGSGTSPAFFNWDAGFSLGGPLSLKKQNAGGAGGFRGRPSFFADFSRHQGDRLQSQYASVPTLRERQGDFSRTVYLSGPLANQPVRLYHPVSGTLLPGAVIPGELISPVARQILPFIPLPNLEQPYLNYFTEQTLADARTAFNLRIQLPLAGSLRLSTGWQISQNRAGTFNIFPDLAGIKSGRGQNLQINLNHTLRPGLMHAPRFRWNRNRNGQQNPFAYTRNVAAELGIAGTSGSPVDYGVPVMDFTNYQALDDGQSSLRISESTQIGDALTWMKGRHLFTWGAEYTWRRNNQYSNPSGAGTLTFAGVASSQWVDGKPVAGTGYDFADFLLGLAQSSYIQYGNTDHYLRRRELALSLNDNWRLHSRLTLQWGLRYEFIPPWLEKYDRMANLDVAPGFSAVAAVTPGQTGPFGTTFPRTLVRPDYNNLAPRLGLAFRARSGKYPSVWRASYGVFYPSDLYNSLSGQLIAQPPFGYTVSQTATGPDYLAIQEAFLLKETPGTLNTYAADPGLRQPAVQNWNISWQQSLPGRFFVSLGYAGARGTGLEMLRAPNRLTEDGTPVIDGAARFIYLSSGGSSIFHGLQLLATRRIRSGFTVNMQYEFGRSEDNASSIAGSPRLVIQDENNAAAEWGRSSFDRRHKFRLNWFWELPFGSRQRFLREPGWGSRMLSNWFLTGTLTAESGLPFTPRLLGNQIDNSGTGSLASERASLTGQPIALPESSRTFARWFNTGAFTLPAPGTFGNASRGCIEGPGWWGIDFTLSRSIAIDQEGKRILISVRARNLLNHPNVTGLNTTVNSTGFGQVTSMGAMRQITARFRFTF